MTDTYGPPHADTIVATEAMNDQRATAAALLSLLFFTEQVPFAWRLAAPTHRYRAPGVLRSLHYRMTLRTAPYVGLGIQRSREDPNYSFLKLFKQCTGRCIGTPALESAVWLCTATGIRTGRSTTTINYFAAPRLAANAR